MTERTLKMEDYKQVRAIRPIDSAITPTETCVFDIENDENSRTLLCGFQEESGYLPFRTEREFLSHFLDEKYSNHVCFAHNGSRFDFQRLLYSLASDFQDTSWDWACDGGTLLFGTVKQDGSTWKFSDSCMFFRDSLDSIGKKMGMEGKKGSHKMRGKELIAYNKQDCLILSNLVSELKKASETLGFQLKTTPAATAFNYFKRQLDHSLLVPSSELFADAYFGGKILLLQPDFQGKGFLADVNSLYTYVTCQPLPHGAPVYYTGPFSPSDSERMIENEVGFGFAEVNYPRTIVPALPVKANGHIIYPVGKFSGFWAFPDLAIALKHGCKVRLRTAYIFKPVPFMEPCQRSLFNLRKAYKSDGNYGMEQIIKILLNSNYGKFGERTEKTSISSTRLNNTSEVTIIETPEGILTLGIEKKTVTVQHRSPAIAAYITALARHRLHTLIDPYQDKLIYSDTDSAYLPGSPEDYNFDLSNEMGNFKIEDTFDKFVGLAPKFYGYRSPKGWVVKSKGFPLKGNCEVNHKTKCIYTQTGNLTIEKDGETLLSALKAGYDVHYSAPASFALAARKGVGPGDWTQWKRSLSGGPGSTRVYIPGMQRTYAPTPNFSSEVTVPDFFP
jgi:hypothetical protein